MLFTVYLGESGTHDTSPISARTRRAMQRIPGADVE
jgi:hypothetical protein